MGSSDQRLLDTGFVQVVFGCDAPFTDEALRSVVERHTEEIARIDALTTIHAGDEPTVELSFAVEDADLAGPACELEALAAVHELELGFAAEGFALKHVRRAA